MDISNKTPNQTKQGQSSNRLPLNILLIVLLIAVLSVTIYALKKMDSRPAVKSSVPATQTQTDISKTAEIIADPATLSTPNGQVASFSVWVDTGGQLVGVVEVIINYPAEQYELVSIDDNESAFKINADSAYETGKVTISRGQMDGVSGKHLVAKINLKAKSPKGQGNITFSDESKVLTLSDNPQNIFNKSSGATLTISE